MLLERLFAHAVKPTLSWAALAAALGTLAGVQIALSPHWGLWIDEVFSLWTSDPAAPAAQSLSRITGDSNPPLYFASLRLVRAVVAAPHAAFLILNALALAATIAFVLATAWRSRVVTLAVLTLSAFVLSGPTFLYIQEGRAYFLGLCIAFATSWLAALTLSDDDARPTLGAYVALGVLAALTHVFSALFAGSLAAGLLVYGLLAKRSMLVNAGLALGVAATLTFALWLATAYGRLANVAWIDFTAQAVRDAVWYVRSLSIGPAFMAAPLALFLAILAWLPRTRPLAIVFGVAGALFVALPLAASVFTPMINGRYWLIGAPALVIALAFLARALFESADWRARYAGLAVIVFFAATAVTGFVMAKRQLIAEPVWRHASTVSALAFGCSDGAVRVVGPPFLYAEASRLPERTFIEANGAADATPRACPVIAWFEHVRIGVADVREASDAALLQSMGLDPGLPGVRVVKHASGFMVLREETATR